MSNLTEERGGFESLGLSYPPVLDIKIETVVIGDVVCHWFIPENTIATETVVYFHGGGFIYGSLQSHRAMVSHITQAIGRKILLIEYALAPEYPFPAALNEVIAVIRELTADQDFRFGLMGDSAGGNLAISTALELKTLGLPLPLYQVVISPWVNMETTYSSYTQNEKLDPIISRDFVRYAASLYAAGQSLKDPRMSPVYGDLGGFEPTLILVGSTEVLRDDSLHLYAALQNAGSSTVLKIFDRANHVWTLTDIASRDGQLALTEISMFLNMATSKKWVY